MTATEQDEQDDRINLVVIEMWHEGVMVARWKSRGKALDGSGTTFLHQQFKTASDGRRIVYLSEVTTMTDEHIRQLMEVPGVWLAKGDEPDER